MEITRTEVETDEDAISISLARDHITNAQELAQSLSSVALGLNEADATGTGFDGAGPIFIHVLDEISDGLLAADDLLSGIVGAGDRGE